MNMRNNQSSAQQYQQAVNQNIIGQSIGWASQLMVFEIK
jgi:hypothetical protein